MNIYKIVSTSIRNKIILGIICLLILPMLFVYYFSYNAIENIMIDQINKSTLDKLIQTDQKIADIQYSLINASNFIANDENVINLLKDGDENSQDSFWKLKKIQILENAITNVKNSQLKYRYNCNIVILTDDGEIFGHYYDLSNNYISIDQSMRLADFRQEDWYKQVALTKGFFEWIAPHNNYLNSTGPTYISLGRSIIDQNTYKSVGTLLVSIKTIDFENELKGLMATDNSKVFIINQQGQTMFTNISDDGEDDIVKKAVQEVWEDKLFEDSLIKDINGNKVLLSSGYIESTGWRTIYAVSLERAFADIHNVRKKYLFTMEILLLIFSIFLIILVNRIIEPVKRLKVGMNCITKGNFNVQVNINSTDELGSLGSTFNSMSIKIKELIIEIERKQKNEQKLTFEALQAQINPHFVFNSLNTIKLAAETSQAFNISKMVSQLGKMLRYTIDFKMEEISLKDEIDYINSYVFFHNVRFNNGINLIWRIDEELQDIKIMKFILQPIIENSIIHGFEDCNFGDINLMVEKRDDFMQITVQDNGRGMTENTLNILCTDIDLNDTKPVKYSRIGLKNINERLRLKYGEQYSFTITSSPGKGTCSLLKIPVKIRG